MPIVGTTGASLARRVPEAFPVGDAECIAAVVQVYADSPRSRAFQAAVTEWRRRNPSAAPHQAPIAVANIICKHE